MSRNASEARTHYSVGDVPWAVVVHVHARKTPLVVRMTYPELRYDAEGRVEIPVSGPGSTGGLYSFDVSALPETFEPFVVRSHFLPARFAVEGLDYEVAFGTDLAGGNGPAAITDVHVGSGVTRETLGLPWSSLLTAALMASAYEARIYPANYDGEYIGWGPLARLVTKHVHADVVRLGARPTEADVRATAGKSTGRPKGSALRSDEKLSELARLWNEAPDGYVSSSGRGGRVAYVQDQGPEWGYHESRIREAVAECRRRGLIPPSPRSKPTKRKRRGR
jgi:hypothetical protein